MTDNEKRAHDISVAMLLQTVEMRAQEAASNMEPDEEGKISIRTDVYKIYLELYNMILKNLNNDFPDGL